MNLTPESALLVGIILGIAFTIAGYLALSEILQLVEEIRKGQFKVIG